MTLQEIKDMFIEIYGGDKDGLRSFYAPGRVNLIGEHTDYNGGLVFPAALEFKSIAVLRPNNERVVRLKATDLDDVITIDIDKIDEYKDLWWGNYQAGVISEMLKDGYDIVGCDMLFDDTVPHGSGLSSSAAIEVVTALAFATLHNEKNGITKPIDKIELAKISQRAENNYVGVKCGIMDQFASAMGKEGHAVALDCATLEYEHIPVELGEYKIVISNTKKKHSLGASKYNERRQECEDGLVTLKSVMPEKENLGSISVQEFEQHKDAIKDETVLRRVRHVITENDRVKMSTKALSKGELNEFGKMMSASHESLKKDYEVSCAELDVMVEEALKIKGVLGSRMTGAGFGGCTVSIVASDSVDEFIAKVGENYENRTGIKPEFYVTKTGEGCHEIK